MTNPEEVSPRAWIIQPTGQTPTLAWMCRECWAGGGNLNEAAPHSVSTKHAVQFERIDVSPTTEEVRPTEPDNDDFTIPVDALPVARGADAEHASAPSTEPEVSVLLSCGHWSIAGTQQCDAAYPGCEMAVPIASPAPPTEPDFGWAFHIPNPDDAKCASCGHPRDFHSADQCRWGHECDCKGFIAPSPAPSAPDLSEFDRLMDEYARAATWYVKDPSLTASSRAELIATRDALRSYVASLIPGDNREKEPDAKCSGCGKRLQYTTNGVRGVLRGTFHYCANPECPLHLTARDDFPASTAVYADEIDSSSATPSALVEEAREMLDGTELNKNLPAYALISSLADALEAAYRWNDSVSETLIIVEKQRADLDSRLALATAVIDQYGEHSMTCSAYYDNDDPCECGFNAARSSSLTDTPEGA